MCGASELVGLVIYKLLRVLIEHILFQVRYVVLLFPLKVRETRHESTFDYNIGLHFKRVKYA